MRGHIGRFVYTPGPDVCQHRLAFLPQQLFMVQAIVDCFMDRGEGHAEISSDLFGRAGL
jgi:hypothetical protein